MLGVNQDITERKRLEQQILRSERLATLGQLTGTVAHEIRNPLGVIANSIRVIKHKCSEAGLDLGATLERTDRSIKRCDRIITDLLDFARARGIRPEPTDLDTWLSDVLKEQHLPEGITIKSNLQANGVVVDFDPDELRRAVINVVDNACQAMVNGYGENEATAGGELTVASRLNGERVEIEFADNGPGIPKDILPQVLEPLFSTKSFGTGLGLPTVQRIMEEHDGGLEISSEEGHGTRVTLWLPPPDGGEGVSRG
jgi:signal transduction histidine kinase